MDAVIIKRQDVEDVEAYHVIHWYLSLSHKPYPHWTLLFTVSSKEELFAQYLICQTFESPSLLFKSFSDFICYTVIKALVSEHHFNLLQKWLWRNLYVPQLQRMEPLPWTAPATEIKALSLFVLHSHTQYATAYPPLQRRGSMNLLLLTKHIQARPEQHRDA